MATYRLNPDEVRNEPATIDEEVFASLQQISGARPRMAHHSVCKADECMHSACGDCQSQED